jgi:hypothetical protein
MNIGEQASQVERPHRTRAASNQRHDRRIDGDVENFPTLDVTVGAGVSVFSLIEAANSACGISIPLALSRIIKAVTRSQSQSLALLDNLTKPLLLFLALGLGEVLFGSLGRSVQLRISPRQRQEVTRETYAYLQHHSHRYFNDNFAGALVRRTSEMSQGVNMIPSGRHFAFSSTERRTLLIAWSSARPLRQGAIARSPSTSPPPRSA